MSTAACDDQDLPPAASAQSLAQSGGIEAAEALFELAKEDGRVVQTDARYGGYLVLGSLGRGGMGEVVTAQQAAIRREVAMKILAVEDEAARLRFVEEAQVTGQLEHPNIVPVHELAIDPSGRPYYTMKLVRGTTVAEILDRLARRESTTIQEYPIPVLLTVFQKVCDAVAFAHSRGVIHRDLKPANVMVGDYGEVLVMDWGVAKVLGSASGIQEDPDAAVSSIRFDEGEYGATLAGMVLGTPQYMAPEQARGERDALDPRADIYSLGAMLYHMLTLQPVVAGNTTREMIDQVARGDMERAWSIAALSGGTGALVDPANRPPHLPAGRVPGSLVAVLRKAMALRPADRYPTVLALQRDIAAFQSGFAPDAENAGWWKQSLLFVGRHKAASISVAASLLLVALLTVSFLVKVLASERMAERARQDAEQAAAWLQAERADALFRADDAGTAIPYLAGILRRDPHNLLAAERLISALSRRTFALPISTLHHSKGAFQCAEFSPGNERVAVGWTRTFDGGAAIFDAATGRQVKRFGRTGFNWADGVFKASWSNDGRLLAAGTGSGSTLVWDADTGRTIANLNHGGRIFGIGFGSSSRHLLTAANDRTAKLWDVRSGRMLFSAPSDFSGVWSAEWNPAGDRILTATNEGTISVWDLAGKPLVQMRDDAGVRSAHFGHEARVIVTLPRSSHQVRIWDAETGEKLRVLPPLPDGSLPSDARLSADGSRLVLPCGNGFVHLWDPSTAEDLVPPFKHRASVQHAAFSQSGRVVITGSTDSTARLWDAETGRSLTEPMRHLGRVLSVRLSRNDQSALTLAELDFAARLWDIRPGGEQPLVLTHADAVGAIRYKPDGSQLLTFSGNTASLWEARTGRLITAALTHARKVRWAEFSPDGRWIATASEDHTARLWDAATGRPHGDPLVHAHRVHAAQFSPDGKRLWTCSSGGGSSNFVTAWELPGGKPVVHWPVANWITQIEFSPDGKSLFWPHPEGLRPQLVDAVTGAPLANQGLHSVTLLALQATHVQKGSFSPDGEKLITATASSSFAYARIWSGRDGQPLSAPLHHDAAAHWAEFSPDGKRALTASSDGTVKIWDASTGELLAQPLQHPDGVHLARFSHDGRRIVTTCKDGAARIWDAKVGQMVREPFTHGGALVDATFSPDDRSIATAGKDGVVRIWSAVQPPLPVPAWLPELAEAASGSALDRRGIPTPLPPDRLVALRTKLLESAADDFHGRWARWFFADRSTREISAESAITVPQYIDILLAADTPDSLSAAHLLDPAHPRVLARLAWRLIKGPRKPAGRDRRAEAVYLARRASSLAPGDSYIQKLAQEVETAGRPENPAAKPDREVKSAAPPPCGDD